MSSDVVIRAEGLGKKYMIGHQSGERYTSLRDVMAQTARNFARTASDMVRGKAIIAGDEVEEFWALKDVSFEIKRGDVVGIIGRNGAGKSTLLKVLSRITEPSEGRVEIKGRVASLLEVGTGFHPELTGRENIYLNGAILGMSREEIKRKFDEIVDFSGVEKFLDTPVKRYSSGMYVRLAFAVAAHLEPEILIVDEVLAVGDAEFQRKCLGKMQDVAGHGRTVLFVSHNMAAIQALCYTGIVLSNGKSTFTGSTAEAVSSYISQSTQSRATNLQGLSGQGRRLVRFQFVRFFGDDGSQVEKPTTGKPINLELSFEGDDIVPKSARVGIGFSTLTDVPLFLCANESACAEPIHISSTSLVVCRIAMFPLTGGAYNLNLFLEREGVIEHWLSEPYRIEVEDAPFFNTPRNVPIGHEGKSVLVANEWRVK